MGGYGSGRHGGRHKAEDCRSLDVNKLNRDGCLKPGWTGSWQWSVDGQEVARISLSASHERLVLDYNVSICGGPTETIMETMPLLRQPCRYGGTRPYFSCPGVVSGRACNRRVAKLYSGGRYFLCRHCYNLTYRSRSEPRYNRMLRRANKLRTALDGEPGTTYGIANKPKGMWQRTYDRKIFEIEWWEEQANRAFIGKHLHLLSKENIAKFFGPMTD